MEEKFKFTAFISYSHADQGVVKWLHRGLEQYRVPVKLVGKETPAGEVPEKFKPFFRDRDDLSAAASLTDSIKEALGQSKFLIVVCTPSSAKSKWVEKEIQEFRRVRGKENILCLVAGPEKTNIHDHFPPALFAGKGEDIEDYEPIAPDMRKSGDGKRMAKLKLISGLLGVQLDTLVQRESKRRQIQMVVMAATFSLATIVLSVLLFMAVEARKEAEANRQEAEELVNFMLGDLREKLEPIGSLQLMDTISIRALEYYSKIDPEKMTNESLASRSRVLLMLGSTQELRGNSDAARNAFLDANSTLFELLKRDPENRGLIFDYAKSVYWLGANDLRVKDYASAENFFQQYAENSEKLAELEPENQTFKAEVGYAYSNLGEVKYAQGKFLDAQLDFGKALEIFRPLAEENSNSLEAQFDLAQTYAWLSDSQKEMGQFREAEDLRQRERRIYTVILNEDADNRGVWGNLASTYSALGSLATYKGEEKEALSFTNEGIRILRGLIAYDRENTEWRENLTDLYLEKGRALIADKEYPEAEGVLINALEVNDDLLAINPGFSDWVLKDFQARALLISARLEIRKRNKKEQLEAAKVLASDFYQTFPPEERTSEGHFLSAQILNVLALAYRENGDKEAARNNWQSAYNILKPFEATGGLEVYTLLPKVNERLSKK